MTRCPHVRSVGSVQCVGCCRVVTSPRERHLLHTRCLHPPHDHASLPPDLKNADCAEREASQSHTVGRYSAASAATVLHCSAMQCENVQALTNLRTRVPGTVRAGGAAKRRACCVIKVWSYPIHDHLEIVLLCDRKQILHVLQPGVGRPRTGYMPGTRQGTMPRGNGTVSAVSGACAA